MTYGLIITKLNSAKKYVSTDDNLSPPQVFG